MHGGVSVKSAHGQGLGRKQDLSEPVVASGTPPHFLYKPHRHWGWCCNDCARTIFCTTAIQAIDDAWKHAWLLKHKAYAVNLEANIAPHQALGNQIQ